MSLHDEDFVISWYFIYLLVLTVILSCVVYIYHIGRLTFVMTSFYYNIFCHIARLTFVTVRVCFFLS